MLMLVMTGTPAASTGSGPVPVMSSTADLNIPSSARNVLRTSTMSDRDGSAASGGTRPAGRMHTNKCASPPRPETIPDGLVPASATSHPAGVPKVTVSDSKARITTSVSPSRSSVEALAGTRRTGPPAAAAASWFMFSTCSSCPS